MTSRSSIFPVVRQNRWYCATYENGSGQPRGRPRLTHVRSLHSETARLSVRIELHERGSPARVGARIRSSLAAPLSARPWQGSTVQPKLVTLSGPLGKSEFRFSAPLSIGRDASNPICIEDVAVSPRHCQIAFQNEGFLLTDLDTGSGTFVNGIPIKQRVLTPGAQIAVGSSLFIFQVEGAAAQPISPEI